MSRLVWEEVAALFQTEAFAGGTRLCIEIPYAGQTLTVSRGDSAEEPPSRDLRFWRRIKEELEALDRKAREVLRHSFPAEKIATLPLTELALDQDESYGVFALGYDTGETLAGRLYLFVPFDEDFQPCSEPICELC